MKKADFSILQIAEISKKVITYKSLFVTTTGQMFRNSTDAEEAVRTLNMISEDTNEHVGVVELTAEMLSADKLKMFAKSPTLFGKLFEKAKIPVTKKVTPSDHKRMRESASEDAEDVVDDVEVALGLKEAPKAAAEKTPKP